jgi:curved DNA-binding protein
MRRRFFSTKFQKECDYYSRLGLTNTKSTADEIKQKYYELAKRYHPDTQIKPSKEDDERFKQITEAYEILGDLELR